MPKVVLVRKARKAQGNCGKCSTPIQVGDSYYHTTLKTGPYSSLRKVRCTKSECRFRQSDLTNSKVGDIYSAQEAFEDFVAQWDRNDASALTTAVQEMGQEIQGVAEMYQESADNIEEGFGHATQQSEELADNASMLSDWASELEQFEASEFEMDVDIDEDETDQKETWADEQLDAAQEVVDNCPL